MINENRMRIRGSLNCIPCIWFHLINPGTKAGVFLSLFRLCYFMLLNEIWVNWSKSAKTQLGLDPPNFLMPRFFPDGFSCRQFNINSVWHARRIFSRPVQALKDNYTVSCHHCYRGSEDNWGKYVKIQPTPASLETAHLRPFTYFCCCLSTLLYTV